MSFSIGTFAIQILNFILLAYILYRVLYKPLRAIMEKRKRLLMEDIDKSMRIKEEAVTLKEKYEKLISEADRLYEHKMEEAVEAAEARRHEMLDRATREADDEKDKARAVIETERREMTESVRKGAADAAGALSASLLGDVADEHLHERLVEMLLVELEEHPPARHAGPEGASKAVVSSAYGLTPERRTEMESLLLDRFGPGVELEFQTDSGLVAGVKVWVDGLVLDGSIKGQVAAFVRRAERGLEAAE